MAATFCPRRGEFLCMEKRSSLWKNVEGVNGCSPEVRKSGATIVAARW
jgi:hypothetical protein